VRLLLSCPDRPGLVAAVAEFLASRRLNITDVDQHSTESGRFYMRMVFDSPVGGAKSLGAEFAGTVAAAYEMRFRLTDSSQPARVVAMASKPVHCLRELLWRFDTGDLPGELAGVVSNHPDHREEVERLGVAYSHVVVDPESKAEAEERILRLIEGAAADLVVLARYMQVLSADFLERVGCPVINIHHSFLPSFAGAEPYRQAQERGVKLIGATAHYVTEDLDAGPIIEQDTARVSHRDELAGLVRLGEEVERSVLVRAVRSHLEDRVIVDGNRTVVL